MQVTFLLGPAGSGKTFRCLAEARAALGASVEGPALLLVAPKQMTFQLERQLLADPSTPGYTRLHVLSFERLAWFIFARLGLAPPELLEEEGRLMVLRGLLARKRDQLKLFRASARLTGFAQQLSLVLRELQRHNLSPESLGKLAEQTQDIEGLSYKLQDLATLLRDYLDWLAAHNLHDADCLLAAATAALARANATGARAALDLDQVWVDGFADWSPQELELLAALLPCCRRATLALCLDAAPTPKTSWLSTWSVTRQAFEECRKRLGAVPGADLAVEILPRRPQTSRFGQNPVLRRLEQCWAGPETATAAGGGGGAFPPEELAASLRVVFCPTPEAEVLAAAREVRRHVRAGGRYRDVTVLARKLEAYHEPLQRVFTRYEIPFFLDRRESVSHHPLAEVTRSALRTVAFGWQRDDWFAALKTGLAAAQDAEIDRLENEALARGWQGQVWHKPIVIGGEPELNRWLEELRRRLLPPFQQLAQAMSLCANKPTGAQLAAALREFWAALGVRDRLEEWAATELASSEFRLPNSVHATVWEQMNGWLWNLELAFPDEPLPLREWLPILEAGLANLTVGVIPPALDQVSLGALDRSRNPDLQLAIVLGLNESLFPAPPQTPALLTEADRLELEKRGLALGSTARQQLSRERFYAYIACTRARQRVVLTCALRDSAGAPLNPSPFLARVRELFPALAFEVAPQEADWRESEHASELVVPLLKAESGGPGGSRVGGGISTASGPVRLGQDAQATAGLRELGSLPALASVLERLRYFRDPRWTERLAPELAARLYGPVLRSSVSRLERFAACPFEFFVHSGLKAEERQEFKLDVREQGSFQHDVLALFHDQLRGEHKRWRDITPAEARQRVARIARDLMASYRDGLLKASEQSRFLARIMAESLQDFVEALVGWMREQYRFDPAQVELPFGDEDSAPGWLLGLEGGWGLELRGRIDRVDLCRDEQSGASLCVVVDYKSGQKRLDPVLLAHGLQLQLLAYLNVLRHWPNPGETFGADRLVPAGVFYVSLRGKYDRSANRGQALADADEARKLAYRHTGRFDARALRLLDARPDAREGDQFNYRLTKDGAIHKSSREALSTAEFHALLETLEQHLQRIGAQIFSGVASVAPYRRGAATACDQCAYRSVCRIDPWTHPFRVLRTPEPEN